MVDWFYIAVSFSGVKVLPASTMTEYKWFAVNKLDLNMDGNDLIVLCSLDGMTYVIDKNFETVSYNFGETICGFRAGLFAVDAGVNAPCFCYVTFSNRLILYYDVEVITCKSKSVYATLIEKLKTSPQYAEILAGLQNETGCTDNDLVKKLVKSALF